MSLPAGVILAGGSSSRMGGRSKALSTLAGRPMLSHVIERFQKQVDPLLLSSGDDNSPFEDFGLPMVNDIVERHRGPLTGLCSALQFLDSHGGSPWLALVPCDAPFLPPDLVSRLLAAARGQGKPVAVARYEQRIQPTFSLWHTSVSGHITEAVMATGQPGLKHLVSDLEHTVVDWDTRRWSPFFNVNTPAHLAEAEHRLDLPAPDAT
jgi:molybdopterin-guanine dinucleotide biosynthesis protein A